MEEEHHRNARDGPELTQYVQTIFLLLHDSHRPDNTGYIGKVQRQPRHLVVFDLDVLRLEVADAFHRLGPGTSREIDLGAADGEGDDCGIADSSTWAEVRQRSREIAKGVMVSAVTYFPPVTSATLP